MVKKRCHLRRGLFDAGPKLNYRIPTDHRIAAFFTPLVQLGEANERRNIALIAFERTLECLPLARIIMLQAKRMGKIAP